MMQEKTAIIVAGGSGMRAGGDTPKQFRLLCGVPVLMHTLEQFFAYDEKLRILLVLSEKHISLWKNLCDEYFFTLPHEIVAGGEERFHSVQNGLALCGSQGVIGIHDGVRPLVNRGTIERCYKQAEELGSAIPFIPFSESVRISENGNSRSIDRQAIRIIQTPQVFRADILKKAYEQEFKNHFTDDASVVDSAGFPVHLCEGNPANLKITRAIDLEIAGLYMNTTESNQ